MITRMGCIFAIVFWCALIVGHVTPILADSWHLGGPGTRHAIDVEASRRWIILTGSAVIPERMQ